MNTYKYQIGNSWEVKKFNTQKELFRYLVQNKQDILDCKKSVIKHSDAVANHTPEETTTKGVKTIFENDKEAGILKRTIVANTYWWMDSHSDVHIGRTDSREKGVFTNSIANKAHKIFPIDEHKFGLDGRIGKTINLYEAPISWRNLGVGKTGMTEALFADMEVHRSKNERRYHDYLNNEIDQHSVGMQYVDIQLAVSDEEEFPKEYELFQKYIGKIGNRKAVEEQGFFFPVFESKLIEYSCVIQGSNELTPTLGLPSEDTDKSSPPESSEILKQLREFSTRLEVMSTIDKINYSILKN